MDIDCSFPIADTMGLGQVNSTPLPLPMGTNNLMVWVSVLGWFSNKASLIQDTWTGSMWCFKYTASHTYVGQPGGDMVGIIEMFIIVHQ